MAEPKTDHSKRAHALLSASGASRWLNCTPSPRLEDKFKDPGTSSYAAEGTLAHELADIGLRLAAGQLDKKQYDALRTELSDTKDYKDYYSPEMDTEVQKYIDFVMEQYAIAKKNTPGALLSVEEAIDLTHYIPEGFGTDDAIVVGDGILDVDDLKYGKGLPVYAKDNPQLKLYGLGALRIHELNYDIHTVRLSIIQPRLNHIDTWSISVEELLLWGQKVVKPTATKAFAGKGVQKAGDWCRWCKAKHNCATLAANMVKIAANDFKDKPTLKTDVMLLSDDKVLEIYNKLPIFKFWEEAVKGYVLQQAKDGKKWKGYKLVSGRSSRRWKDEEAVKQVLKDELFEEEEYTNLKLEGIGNVEKLVKKANFDAILGTLVIKPQGAPTLVPESDKRPALGIEQAKEDFKENLED